MPSEISGTPADDAATAEEPTTDATSTPTEAIADTAAADGAADGK
jgi:hypothetical protein